MSLIDSDQIESEEQLWKKAKGSYVVLELVEKAAENILVQMRHKVLSSPADALYSFDQFRREFGRSGAVLDDIALSETDLRILVRFLDRDKKLIVSSKDVGKK